MDGAWFVFYNVPNQTSTGSRPPEGSLVSMIVLQFSNPSPISYETHKQDRLIDCRGGSRHDDDATNEGGCAWHRHQHRRGTTKRTAWVFV
mmetsp:Transcript_15758/g.36175  ORF Transcript_15758/g.36175 Transcript_15758/m.36175 type:complete len:90 (+) Transcript_15758:378-647(+)